jgi:hypothetical protein
VGVGIQATAVWPTKLDMTLQASTLKNDEAGQPFHAQKAALGATQLCALFLLGAQTPGATAEQAEGRCQYSGRRRFRNGGHL